MKTGEIIMQQKKRRILIVVLVLLVCALSASLGWIWYDTTVDRSGFVLENGLYYYQDFHARLVTGWQDIDGSRYYFGEDNVMATNWRDIDGNRYYFSSDGTMDTYWRKVDGEIYYLGSDGIMVTDWQDIDGNRYYFDTDGTMSIGWLELDGEHYHFDESGVETFGFYTEEGSTFYFNADGIMVTGYQLLDENVYFFQDDGAMHVGWLDTEEGRSYYLEDGSMTTGWTEIEEKRYYFDEAGIMQTGWLEQGEYRYYLQEDGSAATGPTEIDGETYYFSPDGIHVVLVNRTHSVPDYYEVNLVTITGYHLVSDVCLDALKQMLADCEAAGNRYTFNSAYRSLAAQQQILDLRTEEYMEAYDLDYNAARSKALQSVAIPGTSEHHLGLAVDIVGTEAQAWLAEHCWEYGFILRYTAEKQAITGFINEPWHFRYVGTEVSMDMKDSGLCLEEYLGAVPIEETTSESASSEES